MISLAGKVTAGLVESNGSLPLCLWLTCGLTAKKPGSAPCPILVIEYFSSCCSHGSYMYNGVSVITRNIKGIYNYPIQSNSSVHHYECIALYKDINPQRGRFWASSLASCSSRSTEARSPWMVFIQVVCGRFQLSEGGSKMTWLASAFSSIFTRFLKKERWRDLTMNESGGWLVIWWTSAFLSKSCQ